MIFENRFQDEDDPTISVPPESSKNQFQKRPPTIPPEPPERVQNCSLRASNRVQVSMYDEDRRAPRSPFYALYERGTYVLFYTGDGSLPSNNHTGIQQTEEEEVIGIYRKMTGIHNILKSNLIRVNHKTE